jgi:hypothetical protein
MVQIGRVEITKAKRAGGVAQVVEALSSNPSTAKKKKKKEEQKEGRKEGTKE